MPEDDTCERCQDFWGALLGASATIKCMPLFNIIALFMEDHLDVKSILYYSDHMPDGRTKDAMYIGPLFKEKLSNLPLTACTDAFIFDGASNVQKAGKIL